MRTYLASTAAAATLAALLSLGGGAAALAAEPTLTKEEFEHSKLVYFQRCAGCHGVLRMGATGKPLLPEAMQKLGQQRIERILTLGTEGGMNNFDNELSKDEIRMVSTYVQMEPPVPPEMSLDDMKKTRKVLVEPKDYPTKPQHTLNWENFVLVILRDEGKVGIIDGDTKEVVAKVDTGYAVHVMKETSDGRFWYTMGRDGKMTKIDLWMNPPQVVAEVQVAYDARDVAVSHYGEWKDKYIIGGSYWPPHFAIVDAETMEPLKVVSTRGVDVDGNYVNEARVAALYNTPLAPTWIVAVKELGQLWQVDYSDLDNLRIEKVDNAKFLHDGFFTADHRYFQIAANASNTMVFLDTVERELAGMLETGKMPHPGPGANWIDPKCGPVAGTVHLGEGKLAVWGNDPAKHPDQAWKMCYTATTDGPGLFLRTHPNSQHVWMDQTMHPEPEIAQSVKVLSKETREIVKTLRVTEHPGAVATHIEFNKNGDEAWVSVWAKAAGDRAKGEIVVYDDKTLEEKARIKGLETPTGKFNVYNRMKHVT